MNDLLQKFKYQHQQLISLIIKTATVEKIFILGITVSEQKTETVFENTDEIEETRSYVAAYYLLVLTSNDDKSSYNSIQDKIENSCRPFFTVTAIVAGAVQFNNWLTEGQSFAWKVRKQAPIIYDDGNTLLEEPAVRGEQQISVIRPSVFNSGINKVHEFLAGADLYRIREQNKLAAFMLHQAAEHALHTLLQMTTGLYVNTHNIVKLIRCCSMVSYKLSAIFPRNNENNERLFQLLQKAYIDTRYKENYSIGFDDLLILTNKIRALECLVKERFSRLAKC